MIHPHRGVYKNIKKIKVLSKWCKKRRNIWEY